MSPISAYAHQGGTSFKHCEGIRIVFGKSFQPCSLQDLPVRALSVKNCNARARTRGGRKQKQVVKNNDDHRSIGALLDVTSEGGVLVFFTDCKELIGGIVCSAGKAAATYARIQVQTAREPCRFPVAPGAYTE